MEEEIEKIKRAIFISWAWAYNPELLAKEDLDWFYDFAIKKYVKNPPYDGKTETPTDTSTSAKKEE